MSSGGDDKQLIAISNYDGTTDVTRWLLQLEAAADSRKWEEQTQVYHAILHLKEDALRWAENSGATSIDKWEPFKQQITLRYKVTLNDSAIRIELNKISRNKGESIFSYSDRLQAIFTKAENALAENVKLQSLIKGVQPDMRFALYIYTKDHKDCTFTSLVRLIHDYEALSFTPNPPSGHPSDKNEPILSCTYCGKHGHGADVCRKKQRDEKEATERNALQIPARLRSEQHSNQSTQEHPSSSTSSASSQ